MRDARLLQAFFATLESDGVRIGMVDQARMRVLFATRNQWDLTTVRVALRSLLIHDPHQRASFDRHFSSFFASMDDDQPTIPADQLRRILDDLRNLQPDKPEPIKTRQRIRPPADIAGEQQRRNWRKQVWEISRSPRFIVACVLVVVIGVVFSRPTNSHAEATRLQPRFARF